MKAFGVKLMCKRIFLKTQSWPGKLGLKIDQKMRKCKLTDWTDWTDF